MSLTKRVFIFVLSIVFLFSAFKVNALSLSAKSAVVIDGISGKTLFSVNQNQKLPMASTTKIMTALLLCENADLSKTLTVTEPMILVEGTSMGLRVGMKVTFCDLLYGILLLSGNDAANAAAIGIGGSIENFVALMNKKAQELKLNNTHFDTPSGLDGQTHYTTALDLAMLTKEALKNNDFAKAVATSSITLEYGGTKHTLTNHNRLLWEYDGAVGVKTGFTKKSGRCLVSAAKRENGLIIAVTLNDPNDWQDHKNMLDYGFSLLNQKSQSFSEDSYEIPVLSGTKNTVTVKSQPISFKTAKGTSVIKKVYLLPFLTAPVSAGEKIGYIEYYCENNLVAKQNLIVSEKVEVLQSTNIFFLFLNSFKKLLKCI